MHINKLKSHEDYITHQKSNSKNNQLLKNLENKLQDKVHTYREFWLDGYSWTAQENSQFLIDSQFASHNEINFRERLVCNKTHLNNRTRGCIHIFESYFKAKTNDDIYITEQFTLLARWMAKKYNKLYLSEYLSDCSLTTKIKLFLRNFPQLINHQDLTKLSFTDNRFKFILSFDCLEHIPDYKSALKEIYRTLKPNGTLLFSVPFDINSKKHLIRAIIENGEIKHQCEPEYHGNPVSNTGCLSFYTFG